MRLFRVSFQEFFFFNLFTSACLVRLDAYLVDFQRKCLDANRLITEAEIWETLKLDDRNRTPRIDYLPFEIYL